MDQQGFCESAPLHARATVVNARVLARFLRRRRRAHAVGAPALGVAIVRQHAEAQGGPGTAEQANGGGSLFTAPGSLLFRLATRKTQASRPVPAVGQIGAA